MPSKPKGAPKTKEPTAAKPAPKPNVEPATINERSTYRYEVGNPITAKKKEVGLHGLTPSERAVWANLSYVRNAQDQKHLPLPNKATKDLWKSINESGIPLRALSELEATSIPSQHPGSGAKVYDWGRDRIGRDIGEYDVEDFRKRRGKKIRLAHLEVLGREFQHRRRNLKAEKGLGLTKAKEEELQEELEKERATREELARLKMELYGQKTAAFSKQPEWDDVQPVPQEEGEGALASIAYGDEYAEAMSYLRAVMATKEHTPRCLRLTETIIMMNPAHYTVWLYRFSIISALNISIPDEIDWLNRVSLAHLKNYQIWHHRQLLLDHHYPLFAPPTGGEEGTVATADNSEDVKKFALSELSFVKTMLDEDAKNYHVWSYRQYLVRKLGLWNLSEEMSATETLILEDVRNNSAWSHRFFLVFYNPKHASTDPEIPATKHDPKVPDELAEREIQYALGKIEEAPQNQSPWNYVRGVMVRAGRKFDGLEGFCGKFVKNLGEEMKGEGGEGGEVVTSSHALDMLAEIWAAKGETEKADLALRRLAEKWDRVREGYWSWRRKCLAEGK